MKVIVETSTPYYQKMAYGMLGAMKRSVIDEENEDYEDSDGEGDESIKQGSLHDKLAL